MIENLYAQVKILPPLSNYLLTRGDAVGRVTDDGGALFVFSSYNEDEKRIETAQMLRAMEVLMHELKYAIRDMKTFMEENPYPARPGS